MIVHIVGEAYHPGNDGCTPPDYVVLDSHAGVVNIVLVNQAGE